MTNEERRKAAEWFRNRAKNCPMPGTRRMYEIATEALEMAIRALEGDGDMISRQQAIEFIDYLLSQPCKRHTGDFVEGMKDGYYRIRSGIKYLPSAQPRKKGKWIILPPIFEEICQCSKCKMKFKDALQWTNYCPNCGAEMRGESDE